MKLRTLINNSTQNGKLSRLLKNIVPILVLAAICSSAATIYLITENERASAPNPKKIMPLILIDLALMLTLFTLISLKLTELFAARKKGFVGSRLQTKIVIMFSLVSAIPTIIVASFSVFFFIFGVQAWFDEKVGAALEESVAVAEGYLSEHKDNIKADILLMANDLNMQAPVLSKSPALFKQALTTQTTLRELTEAIVFRGRDVLAKTDLTFSLLFETDELPQDAFEEAAKGDVVVLTNQKDDRVRAIIKLNNYFDTYLLVGRFVDSKVLNHINLAKNSSDKYQQLRSNIYSLQIQFALSFVIIALLILTASVGIGINLSRDLVNPIIVLISATEKVKSGDLNARVEEGPHDDEVGTLGKAFNRMAQQLQKNQTQLLEVSRQIDARRRLIEAVLSGVSAGIIALDSRKIITLFNRSVPILLGIAPEEMKGKRLVELMPEISHLMEKAEKGHEEVVNGEISIIRKERKSTFLVRIVKEEFSYEIEGYIVTLDDITQLLTAQRTAAWGDVARRIAHEIKNPLTPIHLAAERIRQKYQKEITSDPESFDKYIETIIKHLGNIGKIVEEFTNFARMPSPIMGINNITDIVKDVIFSQEPVNNSIAYKLENPGEKILVNCDRNQISQVLINLFKNAVEAIEEKRQLYNNNYIGKITTRIKVSEGNVLIEIEDNGPGFPPDLMDKITEPYVTTKEKGTGLGLAIAKKVISDHEGSLLFENKTDEKNIITGGLVKLIFPILK